MSVLAVVHDLGLLSPGSLTANDQPAEQSADTGADGEAQAEEHTGHLDPVAPVLAGIVLILLAAKVGGDLFERMGMPAVLGELAVGVILGNFALLFGTDVLEQLFKLPFSNFDRMRNRYRRNKWRGNNLQKEVS